MRTYSASLLLLLATVTPQVQGLGHAQKITLTSRVSHARSLKRRALSSVDIPLADQFNGTDLEWFGNISVGTPPQILPVVFDTGSSTLEFASTLCGDPCKNQIQFDPTQSSTFVDGVQEATFPFTTAGGVAPVVGDSASLTVRIANDTVSFGNLTVANASILLITNQTATFFPDPYSGIQGLGSSGGGLFGGLIAQGLPALFGMFLTNHTFGNAELTLGGIDETKFEGNLTYGSVPTGSGELWQLNSTGIAVNGKTTCLLDSNRTIIFDSGTSNVVFSTNTTEAIYSLISADIKPNAAEPGTYGIACDLIPTLPAEISITFTDQNGVPFNLTIPSVELSVGPFANNASECQTLINALDGQEILGGSLLKHYYTVYDVGEQRLGFAAV